ncbi:DegQ family serine endoprotease [Ectothiorhodospiraceae bacterium 2226]|nr:DegQ family serine endoprotease [Ectothiorhodospiraceae bacterium 2226]
MKTVANPGIRWWTMLAAAALLTLQWSAVQARAALPDFTELAEQNSPAVVNISTTQRAQGQDMPGFRMPEMPDMPEGPWGDLFRHFFGEGPEGGAPPPEAFESQSLGSGFIIDAEGFVLTNYHVVRDAEEIVVRLADRRELVAELIGHDERSDIALLRIEADDLPQVRVGRSEDLKVGEWVMAIGSPFGFDHSVSVGVVSAIGRSLPRETYVPFIQTDVAINPGNSGGPLFNLDGEVVGINSQIYSRTGGFMGLSFAIPMDMAMDIADQLKTKGTVTRGWLGVLIQDVTRELAESFGMTRPRGALVAQVLEESPASQGGIQVGDVIVEFNGQEVAHSSDLPHLVGRARVGAEAEVGLIRDGEHKSLSLTIEELPREEELAQRQPRERNGPAMEQRLNVGLAELNAEQRQQLGIVEGGVVVTQVRPGPAAQAGIRRGDVITRINNAPVEGLADFQQKVRELPAGRSVPVLIQRQGGPVFIALKLGADE